MNFLFCFTPIPGHVNPTLAVVQELVRRGETVFYFSTANFKDKIEEVRAHYLELNYKMEM